MSKSVKLAGLVIAGALLSSVIALVVLASLGPDTAVYIGRQVPKKFITTIQPLGLLGEGEQIRYFYSDALYDITSGLYFVTNKNLVLYSTEWEEPETIIRLDQITSLDVEYDDSFLNDTVVFVATSSGIEVVFPVSSEKGLDARFVAAIREGMTAE